MKNRHLHARLLEDEYKALRQAADVAGLTVSEYVRNVLLRDRQALSQEELLSKVDVRIAALSATPGR